MGVKGVIGWLTSIIGWFNLIIGWLVQIIGWLVQIIGWLLEYTVTNKISPSKEGLTILNFTH